VLGSLVLNLHMSLLFQQTVPLSHLHRSLDPPLCFRTHILLILLLLSRHLPGFTGSDCESADPSIVSAIAPGTATTSERDCPVRTAGSDPVPIGDSGTFFDVGTAAPELLSPNRHHMITRAKDGIRKPNPRYNLFTQKYTPSEPKTITSASQDGDKLCKKRCRH